MSILYLIELEKSEVNLNCTNSYLQQTSLFCHNLHFSTLHDCIVQQWSFIFMLSDTLC